ncbi:set9 [Malassezia furfur]|nr:set9 [Malassezia furfur]
MDELPADDDLLSCMLLDTLEFEPAIATHKMNPHQRPARFDREAVSLLVRQHVIWERDIAAALAAFMQYRKTPPQLRVFEAHVQRYLQAYLPDAGFEYAITYRYATARRRRIEALGREHAEHGALARAPDRTDLCVLALRSFQPDEVITHCRAALKDLTRADDEALREEAMLARTADPRSGPARPQRDFSIIRSSSRKQSQLLLGPARFINHDCQPNAEFRRSGHQLTIRCIRPIQRDEEITTFYGENYFEPGNRECMCATCERRHRGFFAPPDEDVSGDAHDTNGTAAHTPPPKDARTLRSSTQHAAVEAEPAALTSPIQYAMDPDALGPECTCLTCQIAFRAPERWWTPDECPRCERHYKLYKADWPNRYPTENPAESHTNVRPVKRGAPPPPPPRGPKQRLLLSDSSVSSAETSPVKLSPIRTLNGDAEDTSDVDTPPRPPKPRSRSPHKAQARAARDEDAAPPAKTAARNKRRKYEVRSDDSDGDFDESKVAQVPRILGHDARTDVLAAYWGAPSGQRRARRPVHPHPEPLTDRRAARAVSVQTPATRAPKAKASDAPPRGMRTKSEPIKRETPTPGPASPPRASTPPVASADVAHKRSASTTEHAPPPSTASPKIATKGPERTSVSNLALFWSGGVEGRTRQQARTQRATSEPRASERVRAPKEPTAARAAPPKRGACAHAERVDEFPAPCDGRRRQRSADRCTRAHHGARRGARHRDTARGRAAGEAGARGVAGAVSRAESSGAPTRLPARRNLRWGSGKTSLSRPLPGAASSTGISLLDVITARTSHAPSRAPSSETQGRVPTPGRSASAQRSKET